jgi:hypothetical protein
VTTEKPPLNAPKRPLSRLEQRKQKLATALRANLKRRKAAGRDEEAAVELAEEPEKPKD